MRVSQTTGYAGAFKYCGNGDRVLQDWGLSRRGRVSGSSSVSKALSCSHLAITDLKPDPRRTFETTPSLIAGVTAWHDACCCEWQFV